MPCVIRLIAISIGAYRLSPNAITLFTVSNTYTKFIMYEPEV